MPELGEQSDGLHAGLATVFDPTLVQDVYLVGPHMKVSWRCVAGQV